MAIDWSRCVDNPRSWDYEEQNNFKKLQLRSGKIFLLSNKDFNEQLDHNPAYINIEMRSLVGTYYDVKRTAIILFNPQDIVMLNMLAGPFLTKKINNFRYVDEVNGKKIDGFEIIKWACGTYTKYHPVMNGILTTDPIKFCIPNFCNWTKFYSVKNCHLRHDTFKNDPMYTKKWRGELFETYEFSTIKTLKEKDSFYSEWEGDLV
jgi:hypothetical protein